MTVLSEEAASRRLRAVDASQESIETTSLWIMHHKDSADTMLHSWMNVFRIGTEKQRLALFYVANDVCQKTRKRPGYDMLRSAFVPRLIGAMSLIRSDEAMKSKIIRVVDIWEQREVFEKPTIGELRSALSMTYEDSSDVDERLLLEFDPATLITDLEKFQKIEAAIEKARVILSK
uniref:CID domain-containing protein n=1 Tax=Plectus sambesii TaxID=2011161 RepID=A0A914V0R0_9BILA